jgi:UDP-N-acetylmuramoyl-L-alanyl-D-glutamate--2,6-diaminopimelate ligase
MKSFLRKITPGFLISIYHFKLAFLGALFYGFPSKKIKVIGITGTKGKSTTVYLAGKILEQAGHKVGWTSSLSIKIGDQEKINPYHLTMPGRFFIQKTLHQMVKAGCEYALIEVTSEGIKQFRHKFIRFTTAVFTNLHPEHIEAHHGFENYKKAKSKLFKALKGRGRIIVNADDQQAEYFSKFSAQEKINYGLENKLGLPKSIVAKNISITENGSSLEVNGTQFNLHLLGQFNLYNALAAITIAQTEGVGLDMAKIALEKISKIEGRMEEIKNNKGFRIFVDLAHTPDSFEQVFQLAKNIENKKIIAVFGSAGGGRDKWKRPKLGAIAAKYSDKIIVTNEDPYGENPNQIVSDIIKGFENFSAYEIILDRKQAIAKALKQAQIGDVVLVLGKGTEATMVIGDKKIPWDDRQVVRDELEKI